MFALSRSTPEAQGISSNRILAWIEAVVQDTPELHSFMLLRHGSVVAEGWWYPYRPDIPQMLFSMSKSFTGAAIGIAIGEGRLSLDDRVLTFFPAEAPIRPDVNLQKLRVRHLLSMASGHAQDMMGVMRARSDGQWVRSLLEQPLEYEPGAHFVYNSGCSYLLAAILQKLTGQLLVDYLRPRLFEPLGIENATWEISPEGINYGGWGLSLTTEGIARFGQLLLNKGRWQERQVLPEGWVEQATALQVTNGDDPDSDRAQGYGFQLWRGRHASYRGEGGWGQYCLVLPEQEAVLAITGAIDGNMWVVLDRVWQVLLPGFASGALPEDLAGQDRLKQKLVGLVLEPPAGQVSSPIAGDVSGRRYQMEPNPLGIQAVTCEFGADRLRIRLHVAGKEQIIQAGTGTWLEGTMGAIDFGAQPMIASGIWTAPDTFVLTVRYYKTAIYDTHTFKFSGDDLLLKGGVNLSLGPREYPPIYGKAEK